MPETFQWRNRNGLAIHAAAWMPEGETRAAVALVHGLGEHAGRYQHVAEAFNAAGFALVGFDLPGHGKSEGKRGCASYDEILYDIDCLLEQTSLRCPGKPVFLYGHSLGGALVIYYSLKRRPALKGVIATSPGLAPGSSVSGLTKFFAGLMARIAPEMTIHNGLDLNNLSRDPAVIAAYKEDRRVHGRLSLRLGYDLIACGAWSIENAPSFPLPLFLVQGTEDRLVSVAAADAFAKAVPQDRLTYKVWQGFYHETHNEPEKAQVLQCIIDWMYESCTS